MHPDPLPRSAPSILRHLGTIVLTTAGLLAAAAAQAEEGPVQAAAGARIEARDARQDSRIDRGIASGALTPHEARRLGREQASIDRVESRARADGRLTPREARRLEARQDAASRHIRRQKHDARVRPGP